MMPKPVVGVIGNNRVLESQFPVQFSSERNMRALSEVAGVLPLIFAGDPEVTEIGALLDTVDGILLTGGRANVHPTHFNVEPHPAHEPYDERRDAVALPLIRACVDQGVPVFGVCRGFQEMNVAYGGTLHPEIRDLDGRMNHRMPRLDNGAPHPDPEVLYGDRHEVQLVADGAIAGLVGRDRISVNSLHGQGIEDLGDRVVVEGVADDTTIEAIRISDASGFALGVQWHAEYPLRDGGVNRTLLEAFGAAVKAHAEV